MSRRNGAPRRARAGWLAAALGLAASACAPDGRGPRGEAQAAPRAAEVETPSVEGRRTGEAPAGDPSSPPGTAPASATTTTTTTTPAATSPSDAALGEPAACRAPSLELGTALDARDDAAFARCAELRPRPGPRCGEGEPRPLALARLEAAVLPLDPRTAAHVRAVAARGRALGRNPRAFGLVGDSMTVSGAFLRPLRRPALDPAVADALRIPGRTTSVLDYFRDAPVARQRGAWVDSFFAARAAKV
ncbi:MAG: hypothetical protein IT373_31405, partial [Polyangiaceae bacterium]|nr:hypothetical protein [Polyangiaceae bacterium]